MGLPIRSKWRVALRRAVQSMVKVFSEPDPEFNTLECENDLPFLHLLHDLQLKHATFRMLPAYIYERAINECDMSPFADVSGCTQEAQQGGNSRY